MPTAKNNNCKCTNWPGFTCGYCLQNIKPYFFTLDNGTRVYAVREVRPVVREDIKES